MIEESVAKRSSQHVARIRGVQILWMYWVAELEKLDMPGER
jgi:hypothetical protein